MEDNVIELDYARIWLDEDGIIRVKLAPETEVTLEAMKEMMSLQSEILAGKKAPVLVDMRKFGSSTREARTYTAGEAGQKLYLGAALLIGSSVGRMLGNIFINFSKPRYPTRLFTSEDDALAWLQQFVE